MSGVWDCHAHVIEERYPFVEPRDYTPPTAPLEQYLAMLDHNGIARGVLVQPSVYGFDNRCLLAALERADGRLIGVAVPDPEVAPRDLEALHRRGVRGVRCNLVNSGGVEPEEVLRWQPALADLGWHVAFQIQVDRMRSLDVFLERFTIPVVIDHMGRPDPPDPASPQVAQLIERVRNGDCYVKLSAPYRFSADPAPLARALITANAARCLWASDWPHTQQEARVRVPDLLRELERWCPEQAVRRTILEETPAALFAA